ncbi:MAG: 2-amino-4-hydroxy-6-hydroxymethyldihydropteridine diphosphokinase [Phycisphaerae bacterium]|nr:2-amino-4-hydroxy-6-hydroxymethyldihydropteridine diphosphokinase [Phycisphaerae bacterium]
MEGYVAVGSNLGDRLKNILMAVEMLDDLSGVSVLHVSTLLESDAVGDVDQPDFLNGVIKVRSDLDAKSMLEKLLAIELVLGRDRSSSPPGGPRTIDLDLILWGDQLVDSPELTLPHPRFQNRAFVLVPMVELAPDLVHPGNGKSMRDLLWLEIQSNGDLANRCRPAGRGPLVPPES